MIREQIISLLLDRKISINESRIYIKEIIKENEDNIDYLINLRTMNNHLLDLLLIKIQNKDDISIYDIYLLIEADELLIKNINNKLYKTYIRVGIYNNKKYESFKSKTEEEKKEILSIYFNEDILMVILYKIKNLLSEYYNIEILKYD